MRVLSAWGLALLLSLPAWQSGSAATGDETPAAPARIAAKAREHNARTLPPVGFVRFCGQHPGECTPTPKQRYLERLGLPRSALLIAVVLDEVNEGHAVLMLRTREGDFVLDNRHNRIPTTAEAGYTFLKRQSQNDPREWVSLTPPGKVLARMTD
jgi:predicted transglutaminase-like cysteine proteinase